MATQKSRKKHRKKKKSTIILLVPEGLGLSDAQVTALKNAVKAKADTMITKSTEDVVVITDDIDFSPW